MKTVKRLLCLMLVAMMMVTAIPFAASATEVKESIKVRVDADGEEGYAWKDLSIPEDGVVLDETTVMKLVKDKWEFVKLSNSDDVDVTLGTKLTRADLNFEGADDFFLVLTIKTKDGDDKGDKSPVQSDPDDEDDDKDTKFCVNVKVKTEKGTIKVVSDEYKSGASVDPAGIAMDVAEDEGLDDEYEFSHYWVKQDNQTVENATTYPVTQNLDIEVLLKAKVTVDDDDDNPTDPGNGDGNQGGTGTGGGQTTPPAVTEKVTLTLKANGGTFANGKGEIVKTFNKDDEVDAAHNVEVPTRSGYQFARWTTEIGGTGDAMGDTIVMNGNKTFYAQWIDVDDLTVTAIYYVDGVRRDDMTETIIDRELPTGQNAFNWVFQNKDEIRKHVPAGFTWGKTSSDDDDYFYDYSGKEQLTGQDNKADGVRNFSVKFYANKDKISNVQLYVHKSVGGSAKIYDMPGYLKGDHVSRSDVNKVLEKNYSGNLEAQGLYSDAAWEDLCDGKKPTEANSVEVTTTGTFKIHVILKNGTEKNNNADTSNPKTGDTIYTAVTVMGLTASALALAYLFNKKRIFG